MNNQEGWVRATRPTKQLLIDIKEFHGYPSIKYTIEVLAKAAHREMQQEKMGAQPKDTA